MGRPMRGWYCRPLMPSQIKSIAIASIKDAGDVRSWSGIPAHIGFALHDAGVRVFSSDGAQIREPWYYRWLRSGSWRLGEGWFLADVEPRILKQRAAALERNLRTATVDAVVSVLPDPIVATCPEMPTALVHDCTFALLLDYYAQFTRLSKRSVRLGHEAYAQALAHASVAIYSSEWAAKSAMRDYGADPARVHVVEFGANLRCPPSREQVQASVDARLSCDARRFLFLGAEWGRKGGGDAVALIQTLRKMGIAAFLDIVGCPMEGKSQAREFCIEHGFLDKSKKADRERLEQLLKGASFLVVPSLAECFGCVYCEANAFGVPSIGRDTGGVGQAIRPGVNGFLLSPARSMDELAEQLRPYLLDEDRYRKLAASARQEFEQRLNWGRFAERTLQLLADAKK